MPHISLKLSHNLQFTDLYCRTGLQKLDSCFLEYLAHHAESLHQELCQRRADPELHAWDAQQSNLMLELAPYIEQFIADVFHITPHPVSPQKAATDFKNLYAFKRQFVQRTALKKYAMDAALSFQGDALAMQLLNQKAPLSQDTYMSHVQHWQTCPQTFAHELDLAARYAAWACHHPTGKKYHRMDILFHIPEKTDPDHLLHTFRNPQGYAEDSEQLRPRQGFQLTDPGPHEDHARDQAHYCIHCHRQSKDSCRIGLQQKPPPPTPDPIPIASTHQPGCPLDEKISEMNLLRTQGYTIAALAMIMRDNPLVPLTGHRICNDCRQACIYQKQTPVDIPAIETQTLNSVLELPWGFEIYSLLTRWNPLNLERPLPCTPTGHRVLIVGQGPAGLNLAHHLLQDGHEIIALEGLKVEPLPSAWIGQKKTHPLEQPSSTTEFVPIHDVHTLFEDLSVRVGSGFGGVAEYGITVRWNKNYLRLVQILLQRHQRYLLCDGVRLGSNLTIDQAVSQFNIDHISLCLGAGSPNLPPLDNILAKGVRLASDFLMSLQLTGAARLQSLANLQVCLPAYVVGGGLTAIDTATEVAAYYPQQVKKFYQRYQTLDAHYGARTVENSWTEQDQEIAQIFLEHGRLVLEEEAQAATENRQPNYGKLVRDWGGVTLLYRQDFTQSPSYRLNHEEVAHALEEGIIILENASVTAIHTDKHRNLSNLDIQHQGDCHSVRASALMIAIGTQPNIQLVHEEPHYLKEQKGYFQQKTIPNTNNAPFFTHYEPQGVSISFFGDLHPHYAGSVVKAMASAKDGYPHITRILSKKGRASASSVAATLPMPLHQIQKLLSAHVIQVQRLTPTIIEIIVESPLAAQNFQPGQFYRLQNYETLRPLIGNQHVGLETLALTGAWVDRAQGRISLIVLEMGGSSSLCHHLMPGDPLALMGPTGTPTQIPATKETVLLIGGGLGNAVLLAIAQAFRAQGSRVLYVAGYRRHEDRFKVTEIYQGADQVIWCCDEAPGFTTERPQDSTFVGSVVDALVDYAMYPRTAEQIPLSDISRIIAIGSDGMMAAIAHARHTVLKPYLPEKTQDIVSVNAPMQCMMKGICAQCLQKHVDPETGHVHYVYSCHTQDQPMQSVDFSSLRDRLQQNSPQEKLTALWIQYLQETEEASQVHKKKV